MSMGTEDGMVKIPTLTCRRCGHRWVPRTPTVYVCPKCHSPKWR